MRLPAAGLIVTALPSEVAIAGTVIGETRRVTAAETAVDPEARAAGSAANAAT